MASLSVRQLSDDIYSLLRHRASVHGVSMEEEVRQIITTAVRPSVSITQIFKKHFGKQGVTLNLERDRKPHDPMKFE